MAALPNDVVRINLELRTLTLPMRTLNLDWPPPEYLYLTSNGTIRELEPDDEPLHTLRRVKMSELSEEVARGSEHLARGAEYHYLEKAKEILGE